MDAPASTFAPMSEALYARNICHADNFILDKSGL